jgi:putative membrane protein
MRHRRVFLLLAAASSVVAACGLLRPIDPHAESRRARQAEKLTPAEPDRPRRRRGPGSLGDNNIAAMLLALNNTDISYTRLVSSRAERDDVREYARRMVTDHNGVNALVKELMNKLGRTPEDNNASVDLRDESAENREVLRDLSGFRFDSAYIENEIRYHRKFLESLDDHMLPRARNGELKELLAGVRPAVAAHLAHAEQVRANVLARK